uniref:Uncharacterized protein n=1 Tax=Knipowitschia caucasica TaxID=637954 RepID=A0AAV2KJM5_KNICA
MKDVGKGFDLSPKLQAVEEGMNSSQDQRSRGVPEVEEIFNSGGSFDNKTQDSQNDPGPEKLTKTDHVLTEENFENLSAVTEEAEDMSEDGIEPKITQTDQDSDKYHLKGSKTNEVTQEERESNEPKMLTGFPGYELLSSLSSDFRISTLQFEHNTEYPPNLELEEEFLRLNEGAFCPQDMEEFDDQMDLSLELDMDEDLTEANVRVRPVERYVLIESPPFSDEFSEETRALCESFETIVKDDGGVPIGSNVREVSGFVDVVMSEEQDSGSILRNDGKENVEESGEEWEGEMFRVKDVDNWIQGSLGSASERKEKGLSREECGGSLEGVTTGGNTTKRDGFSQRASVMVEQHADESQTGSISTEAAQKAQTQVPRSEGSLEIPPTPPASEWRVYGRSSGRISASPSSNQDPSVAKTQGWGLCTNKDLSLTKSNVLAVRSEDSKITFAEEKVKTVESSVSLQSTKVSGVVSTEPESVSTQRALSPGRFARADSGEWRVYGHNRDLQSSVPRVLSPTGRPTSPVPMAASPSRFGKGGSGEWRVYGQSQDRQSYGLSQTARLTSPTPTSPVEMGRFAGAGSGEYFGKNSDWTSLGPRLRSPTGRPTSPVPTEMSPVETGRFGKADSGEWLLYGYNRERMSSGLQTLSPTGRPTSPVPSPTSLVERGRFARAGSEEYFGYGKSSNRMSSGPRVMRPTGRPTSPVPMATSPVETGRFARADSGEWRVYGHNRDQQSSGSRVSPTGQPTSPVPGVTSPVEMGRFARADSGEWRVYGTNRERMSHADQEDLLFDSRALSPTQSLSPDGTQRELCFTPPPLSPYGRFSPRTLSPDGSDGPRSLSPEWMVYRSLSPRRFDETQMLADSVNNAKNATTSHASADQLGRWATKDWLVYKSSGGADEKLRKRTLSPPQVQTKQFYVQGKEGTAKGGVAKTAMVKADNTSGKSSGKVGRGLVGSIGKLVSADWRRNKGSKLGVASGGRVISSSDGPIGSSGSGTSTKKERISVCKMAAALSKEKKRSTAPPAVQPGSTSHRSQL